jgi:hypothetical protein
MANNVQLAIRAVSISAVLSLAAPVAAAEDVPAASAIAVSDGLHELVTDLARGFIPDKYEDNRKWGKTTDIFDGLHVRREGWQIKTHRRWKEVNHGTWTRYEIRLRNPEERFKVRLQNLRNLPDGRTAVDIECDARLRSFGRLSQWQYGVQLISLSAEADADVRLVMQCTFRVNVDLSNLPPEVVVDVRVDDANLAIHRFRMRRISQLSGPLVKQLSHEVREVLEDQIARRREKMVQKINQQIAKNEDHLRLSLTSVLNGKLGDLPSLTSTPRQGSGE